MVGQWSRADDAVCHGGDALARVLRDPVRIRVVVVVNSIIHRSDLGRRGASCLLGNYRTFVEMAATGLSSDILPSRIVCPVSKHGDVILRELPATEGSASAVKSTKNDILL